jgi:hypothetical protein
MACGFGGAVKQGLTFISTFKPFHALTHFKNGREGV